MGWLRSDALIQRHRRVSPTSGSINSPCGNDLSVDRQRVPVDDRVHRLAPDVDDEDAIVGARTRGVDHQCAGELLALHQGVLRPHDPHSRGRCPAVPAANRTRAVRRGAITRLSRPAAGCVARPRTVIVESVRSLRTVASMTVPAGTRRSGPGNLRRFPLLAEGRDGDGLATRSLGGPGRHADDQADAECVVLEPAGGTTVVVGLGGGQARVDAWPVPEPQAKETDERQPTRMGGQGDCL